MSDKTWTASGVNIGLITIIRHASEETGQDVLTIVGNSHFVDGDGNVIPELVPQRISKDLVWDDLPKPFKQAYNKFHDYLEEELLEKHGMNG